MDKSTYFSGQPVSGQMISLIDDFLVSWAEKKFQADLHVLKFKTKD